MKEHIKARDMTPLEIREALFRSFGGHGAQAAIARELGVGPSAVSRVIDGATSDRIRRAIAQYIKKDVRVVWPSVYLYGGGAKKTGRPMAMPIEAA